MCVPERAGPPCRLPLRMAWWTEVLERLHDTIIEYGRLHSGYQKGKHGELGTPGMLSMDASVLGWLPESDHQAELDRDEN